MNQSGKSTLAVHFIKEAQNYDIPVIMIDVEGTSSTDNLKQLGADPTKVFLFTPEEGTHLTIEGITKKLKEEIIPTFKKAEKPILIIWDSLASTATEKELDPKQNLNQPGKLMPC